MGRKPKAENQVTETKENESKETEKNVKQDVKKTEQAEVLENYKGGFKHIVTYKTGKRKIEEYVKPIGTSKSFLMVIVDNVATITLTNIGIRDFLDKHANAMK